MKKDNNLKTIWDMITNVLFLFCILLIIVMDIYIPRWFAIYIMFMLVIIYIMLTGYHGALKYRFEK